MYRFKGGKGAGATFYDIMLGKLTIRYSDVNKECLAYVTCKQMCEGDNVLICHFSESRTGAEFKLKWK